MRRFLWVLLILGAASAVTVVAIPTLYIQPFKPQDAAGLARAYAMRQAAPAVTAIAFTIVLVCALMLMVSGGVWDWVLGRAPAESRRRAWIRYLLPVFRTVSVLGLVGVTALATWFCRQNHFEWMFAPPHQVQYVSAKEAETFLTPDEMVMGIEVSGLSLAYPVRQMAYHHVVNDVLGTTPVVVTY